MNLHANSIVDFKYAIRRPIDVAGTPQLDLYGQDQSFLEQLRNEERRSIYFNTPLSIVLVKCNKQKSFELNRLLKVVNRIRRKVRETDIVGYIDEDAIGVLLPDTDNKSAEEFRKRIVARFKNFPFTIISRTYPDQLFHDLHLRSVRLNLLPKSHFLDRLRLEQRRADRYKSQLSISVIWLDKTSHGEQRNFTEISQFLQDNLQETDVVGNLGEDAIGIIHPNTDLERVQEIKNKIISEKNISPFLIKTGTYPDLLICELLAENRDQNHYFNLFLEGYREPVKYSYSLKRGFDIVASLVAIILLLPLMLVIVAGIRLNSPGPAIFKQKRMGKRGVQFCLYKFRSMYYYSDDQIHRKYITDLIEGNLEEVNQGDKENPLYKIKYDPRVTLVGRFIRKTSIDELPQLFNVLKGEMSLVGPRPPLSYEVEKYQSWHLMRILEMKPGITGLWQVSGRSETTFDDMVRLDIRYIRNWSFIGDMKILFKTIKIVLKHTGS